MSIPSTTTKISAPAAPNVRSYLIVLASTVMLSTTGILIKALLTDFHLEPLALAFLRVLLVSLALGVALLIFNRKALVVPARQLPLFALLGALGVGLHQLVWITSVQ